jgi:hypothetical protein
MIIHAFYPRFSLHFTSLHFTSLHITSLQCTSLHFIPQFLRPYTFRRFMMTLQKPFPSPFVQENVRYDMISGRTQFRCRRTDLRRTCIRMFWQNCNLTKQKLQNLLLPRYKHNQSVCPCPLRHELFRAITVILRLSKRHWLNTVLEECRGEGGGFKSTQLSKFKKVYIYIYIYIYIYDYMFQFYSKAIISPNMATLKHRDKLNYGNAL